MPRLSLFPRWVTTLVRRIDWILMAAIVPVLAAGLITMNSFGGANTFFKHQLIWIAVSLVVFCALTLSDLRFLKRPSFVAGLYIVWCAILAALFVLGVAVKGAESWFHFGAIAFEPADPAKLVMIIVLAKYFSRRHIEIRNIRHIIVSGIYAFILFALVFLQPDFGSALIIFCIWFGMVMVSGISKKHFFGVIALGLITFSFLWFVGLASYQKARVENFLHPLSDIRGSGYNAYQSVIAVGSGQLFGKGVGYGTETRLAFLPEYQTDFIFAAFAEEWGFFGVILLFICFGIILWRILQNAKHGESNFETLYGVGLAIFFMSHLFVTIGMNIGLLPVTGITVPFMSYGGSHLITEFVGLGILMSMRGYARPVHRSALNQEMVGISHVKLEG